MNRQWIIWIKVILCHNCRISVQYYVIMYDMISSGIVAVFCCLIIVFLLLLFFHWKPETWCHSTGKPSPSPVLLFSGRSARCGDISLHLLKIGQQMLVSLFCSSRWKQRSESLPELRNVLISEATVWNARAESKNPIACHPGLAYFFQSVLTVPSIAPTSVVLFGSVSFAVEAHCTQKQSSCDKAKVERQGTLGKTRHVSYKNGMHFSYHKSLDIISIS